MPFDLDVMDASYRKGWPREIVISCPTHPELEPITIVLTDEPEPGVTPEALWLAMHDAEQQEANPCPPSA